MRTIFIQLLVCLFAGAFFVACDSVRPDDSEDLPPPQFHLYAGSFTGTVYIIDPDSSVIVDSLTGFDPYIVDLDVTKGGRKLYVSTLDLFDYSTGNIYVVDLLTRRTELLLEESGQIHVSPGGDVLLFADSYERRTRPVGIVDTLQDHVVFIDTLEAGGVWSQQLEWQRQQKVAFHPTDPVFYAGGANGMLLSYDYAQRTFGPSYEVGIFYSVLHAPHGPHLYFRPYEIFDLSRGTVVTRAELVGGPGHLAIDDAGKRLYVTETEICMECGPRRSILVLDAATLQLVDEIYLPDNHPVVTDQFLIVPGSTTAFVNTRSSGIYKVNIEESEIIDFINGIDIAEAITIGPRPLPSF